MARYVNPLAQKNYRTTTHPGMSSLPTGARYKFAVWRLLCLPSLA
ncbi:hypothetical protein OSU_0036 [Vibrio cholerae PS15]|nr:hypothetical protein OSU_0036 [Vibrio cholerae PS15]